MIKTTVVIPNYNGISYLEDCLTFLKRSKETMFETIVVDNGSQDGSTQLIKERFPWVRLICLSENTGFSHAVNVGIKEAKTPYVLLLNNDTVVEHDFVAKLEQAMEDHPKYFSFSSKMLCMKQPEVIDDAGDYYCALGWAFARGKGKSAERLPAVVMCLQPVREQRFTGVKYSVRSDILMNCILHIWKTLMWDIGQGFGDTKTDIVRRQLYIMREADSVVRVTMNLR